MNHRNLPNENVIGRPLGELFPGAVLEDYVSNAGSVLNNNTRRNNNLPNTNRRNNNIRNNNLRNNNYRNNNLRNNNFRNNNYRNNNFRNNNLNNNRNLYSNNNTYSNISALSRNYEGQAPRVNRGDHGPYTDAVIGGPRLSPEFPFSPELSAEPLFSQPRTNSNSRRSRRSKRKSRRTRKN